MDKGGGGGGGKFNGVAWFDGVSFPRALELLLA